MKLICIGLLLLGLEMVALSLLDLPMPEWAANALFLGAVVVAIRLWD